jgi:copper chaperone
MVMVTTRFKTNAKCGGCVAAIGAKLNTLMASDDWSINLADPDKVLEVRVDIAPATVITAVKEAGFKAEQL